MDLFLQLTVNGLVQGALVACLAVGFGFIARAFRVFHVAMGAEYVFSGCIFYAAAALWKLPPPAAVAVTVVMSIAFAEVIEFAVYRPFDRRGASGGVKMVASLGVLIVTENVLSLIFGNEVKTIPHPTPAVYAFRGVSITSLQLLQLGVSTAFFSVGGLLLAKWLPLKSALALGDSPELMRALAIRTGGVRALAAAFAGVAVSVPAMLITADTGIEPHSGMKWLLVASVAAFFGGRDRYCAWGAGAVVLGLAQSLAVWKIPAQWSDTVAFALLLAVLAVRPRGLFGAALRTEELA